VALLTYGEGWHNNHHAYQTSARHGLRWWEVDMTYLAIQTMKLCRIAYEIRLPKIRSATPSMAMSGSSS
jgi:fatty-acid desaturase